MGLTDTAHQIYPSCLNGRSYFVNRYLHYGQLLDRIFEKVLLVQDKITKTKCRQNCMLGQNTSQFYEIWTIWQSYEIIKIIHTSRDQLNFILVKNTSRLFMKCLWCYFSNIYQHFAMPYNFDWHLPVISPQTLCPCAYLQTSTKLIHTDCYRSCIIIKCTKYEKFLNQVSRWEAIPNRGIWY